MLFQLRQLKHNAGLDDSDYIHALHYVDLGLNNLADINAYDVARLRRIRSALDYLLKVRAVPVATMRKALDAMQHAEYLLSFDVDISHIETDSIVSEDMPTTLHDYMELVLRGDAYIRISNLFKKKRRVLGASGKSAYNKYETLAEGCYEEAVFDLCNVLETDRSKNPNVDFQLICEIERWLDRAVDVRAGFQPDITQEGVPRIRGSKSKFSQDVQRPVVGERLRKYWRQRNALVDAALPLLYV